MTTQKQARPALTPYLCCKDASAAIDFYKKAFDATETSRLAEPSGKIGHAEIEIAGTVVMLSDEYPDYGAVSPTTLGGSPVGLRLYVPDVDATLRRAAAAGGKVVRPAEDQFYGDRSGTLVDPFGHRWSVATKKEEVSTAEIEKRYDALMKEASK